MCVCARPSLTKIPQRLLTTVYCCVNTKWLGGNLDTNLNHVGFVVCVCVVVRTKRNKNALFCSKVSLTFIDSKEHGWSSKKKNLLHKKNFFFKTRTHDKFPFHFILLWDTFWMLQQPLNGTMKWAAAAAKKCVMSSLRAKPSKLCNVQDDVCVCVLLKVHVLSWIFLLFKLFVPLLDEFF